MKLSCSLLVAVQVLSVLALPAPNQAGQAGGAVAVTTSAAKAGATEGAGAGAEAGAGGEAGGEAGAENEVEQNGQFGQAIDLGGGNIKTDTQFPPGVRCSSSLASSSRRLLN
jgi:hypothetical protein